MTPPPTAAAAADASVKVKASKKRDNKRAKRPETEAEWEALLSQALPPPPSAGDEGVLAVNNYEAGQEPWRQIQGLSVQDEAITDDVELCKRVSNVVSQFWFYNRKVSRRTAAAGGNRTVLSCWCKQGDSRS